MTRLSFDASVEEVELLDAGEGVTRLLERRDELDLSVPLVDLLVALDEAITDAVARAGTPTGRNRLAAATSRFIAP